MSDQHGQILSTRVEEPTSPTTVPPSTDSVPETVSPTQQQLSATEGAGRILAGYIVEGELGRGGMGVVYKARQKGLNRLVALKMILHASHAGMEERSRFEREARALAELRHPNIVQVYEVGEYDGKPFFSLEYIEGGSLDRRLKDSLLSPVEAARLVRQLADAMQAAHNAGIIHRDLKPANVLLERTKKEGQRTKEEEDTSSSPSYFPKITDFGLAKKQDEGGLSVSGAVMGTPSYMAPEQAAGQTHAIDGRTDVYALGAILYECLTGRPPFRAASVMDTLLQVIGEDPVPVRALQATTPADLETICLKCLRKDPDRRYASAAALAEDLRRFLDGEPITARPTSTVERAIKWGRRRPALASLYAVLAVLLVGLLAGGWWYYLDVQARNEALATETRTAVAARGKAEEKTKEALRALYGVRMKEVRRAWEDRTPRIVRELLAQMVPQGDELDCRGFEWHYLNRVFSGGHASQDELSIYGVDSVGEGAVGIASAFALSPDKRKLYTSYTNGDVKVWDAVTGRLIVRLPGGKGPDPVVEIPGVGSVRGIAMNSDGSRIALARFNGALEVRDTASGKTLLTLMDVSHLPFSGGSFGVRASFSADGKRLAYLSFDQFFGGPMVALLKVVDVPAGQTLALIKGAAAPPVLSPDGKRVAAACCNAQGVPVDVGVWDTATGTRQVVIQGERPGSTSSLAFSQDGRLLAVGTGGVGATPQQQVGGTIGLYDITPGEKERVVTPLRTLHGHRGQVFCLSFSPDGRRLTSGGLDTTVRVWEVETGGEHLVIPAHNGIAIAVAWRSDGRRLLSVGAEQTVKVWNADAPANPLTVWDADSPLAGCAFSSDSLRLLALREDRQLRTFDLRTGNEVFRGKIEVDSPFAHRGAAFSPDLKMLAFRGTNRTLGLYDLKTNKLSRILVEKDDFDHCDLAFSPDGNQLAAARSNRETGNVTVWDGATGRIVFTAAGGGMGVAFSQDGLRIASYFARNRGIGQQLGELRAWDITTGEDIFRFPGTLWNAVHSDLRVLGFSSEGNRIVAGSTDGNIRFWGIPEKAQVLELRGHTRQVSEISFSPEARLASIAIDGTLRFWDLTNALEVGVLNGPPSGLSLNRVEPDGSRILFSPDGHRLLSASTDGKMLQVWDGTPLAEKDRVPPR